MNYKINLKTSLNKELKRILNEQMEDSLQQLTDKEKETDVSVHEFRKNMKKSRAVLRLMRHNVKKESYREMNSLFRDLSKRLGRSREAKVHLDTLEEIMSENELPKTAGSLYDYFQQEYDETLQNLKDNENVLNDTIKKLQQARQKIHKLSMDDDDTSLIYQGIKKVYKRGRKALTVVYEFPGGENFHEWRKRAKYLWYICLLLEEIWPEVMNGYITSLDELSDYLGKEHDLFELQNIILERQDLNFIPEKDRQIIANVIDKYRTTIQCKARPVGSKLYFEKPKMFAKRIIHYRSVEMAKINSGSEKTNLIL